jgi:inner membrane protease subunit 2
MLPYGVINGLGIKASGHSRSLHSASICAPRPSPLRGRYGSLLTHRSSTNPDLLTAKRIVALEGDIVTPLPPMPPKPLRIPPGHCWVEGDSLYRTRDSNTYGPVSGSGKTAKRTNIVMNTCNCHGSLRPRQSAT